MVTVLIGTGCGILALGSAAALYCCMRVGALYDQQFAAHPLNERGKEDAENGAESDNG